MIVLDYLKRTKRGSIIIPPFQSGHLGFMPGREVQVYLIKPHEANTHCEVVVTPYQQNEGHLVRLLCVMSDQRGVVQRLIQAVASLGINIVAQESSSVHYQEHHFVSMVIDLSTSQLKDKTDVLPEALKRYREHIPNAPVNQQKFVELFESIIAHCGDVLQWSNTSGTRLPRLSIRPIDGESDTRSHYPTMIQRASDGLNEKLGAYSVSVALSSDMLSEMRSNLETESEELDYILVSETEQRKLRAFFPKPEILPKLAHLGFYHADKPGTLSAMLDAIAKAGFSILTSLQRSLAKGEVVWEAILEYQLAGKVPTNGEEKCKWVAGKLAKAVVDPAQVELLRDRNVSIALPRYPKRLREWDGKIKLNDLFVKRRKALRPHISVKHPAISAKQKLIAMLEERITSMQLIGIQEDDPQWRLVNSVKERLERSRPTIFLSYPHSAKPLAEILKQKLKSKYILDEYQRPNAANILETVLDKIENCDGFIGIWHHEDAQNMPEPAYPISPWLPFEYGVARTTKKPWILVRSDKLSERVWKRIEPGYSMYEYADSRSFELIVVPAVIHWCKLHMKEAYARLR